MIVDLRSTRKLRRDPSLDVTGRLAPIVAVLRGEPEAETESVALDRLRIVCDWIQYRHNFRSAVDARRFEVDGDPGLDIEVAVDLRRCGEGGAGEATREALRRPHDARLYLEPWGPATGSCVWEFNSLYWRALAIWEKSTGKAYEQALPGGESDARNTAAVRELLAEMFATWDALAARGELPGELFVLELGVGNGNQAKVFLDELRTVSTEQHRDYYERVRYLMCDYSQHVLDLARATTVEHTERVSSVVLDAVTPSRTLAFLREKIFLVYISNVYDNLPTEEIARIEGRTYRSEVRAYLPAAAAAELAEQTGIPVTELPRVIGRLLRLGPELLAEAMPEQFTGVDAVALFWQQVWSAIALEERYLPVELDRYEIAPGVPGRTLGPLLADSGDQRVHVSNGAVASFVDTLPLLHPAGRLQCHDIFVTDLADYRTAFRGPGKFDGSVVNWVNGALLRALAAERGYQVSFARFAHRTGTNISTLTATRRQ